MKRSIETSGETNRSASMKQKLRHGIVGGVVNAGMMKAIERNEKAKWRSSAASSAEIILGRHGEALKIRRCVTHAHDKLILGWW